MRHADRRRFLTRLATWGATIGLMTPATAAALEVSGAVERAPAPEDPWMRRLRGTQRVIFHSHMPTNGLALVWGGTYLDTQRDAYGMAETDCSVVVGLNGGAMALLANDVMWAKYASFGALVGAPGGRNPYAAAVAALLARGGIVLACRNSLQKSPMRYLGEAERRDPARARAFVEEFSANLLPGVEVVPSMVVTLQQAQDRGCRYVYAGS